MKQYLCYDGAYWSLEEDMLRKLLHDFQAHNRLDDIVDTYGARLLKSKPKGLVYKISWVISHGD